MIKMFKESLKYKEGLSSLLTIVFASLAIYPLSAFISNKNTLTMIVLLLSFLSVNAIQRYAALIIRLRDQDEQDGES